MKAHLLSNYHVFKPTRYDRTDRSSKMKAHLLELPRLQAELVFRSTDTAVFQHLLPVLHSSWMSLHEFIATCRFYLFALIVGTFPNES